MRDHGGIPSAREDLGSRLRAWRGRLTPAEAGLIAGSQRRVPGLRREEVAALAGVSVDYLARLEQGRVRAPSASVVGSLARALRLTDDERAQLYRLAGHLEPGPGTIDRHITPSLQRLLDRLVDTPVVVVDAAGEIIAANPLASALIGDLSSASRRDRTIPWRHFTGAPSRLKRSEAELDEAQAAMVADLRDAVTRFPDDDHLTSLVTELLDVSPEFASLWETQPARRTPSRRKTFVHPEVGEITLDCDSLTVRGSDLSVIVYTAPADSADAHALALLAAIGIQSFPSPTPSVETARG